MVIGVTCLPVGTTVEWQDYNGHWYPITRVPGPAEHPAWGTPGNVGAQLWEGDDRVMSGRGLEDYDRAGRVRRVEREG